MNAEELRLAMETTRHGHASLIDRLDNHVKNTEGQPEPHDGTYILAYGILSEELNALHELCCGELESVVDSLKSVSDSLEVQYIKEKVTGESSTWAGEISRMPFKHHQDMHYLVLKGLLPNHFERVGIIKDYLAKEGVVVENAELSEFSLFPHILNDSNIGRDTPSRRTYYTMLFLLPQGQKFEKRDSVNPTEYHSSD